MDASVIVIDSDEEESGHQASETKPKPTPSSSVAKRPSEKTNGSGDISPPSKIRRIQPQKIGEVTVKPERSRSEEDTVDTPASDECEAGPSKPKQKAENEITKELKGFIKACREVEPNEDMKKIIKSKLLKYYHLVHQQYVLSKFFRKMLEDNALAVLKDPRSVYSRLQDIINELKSRKTSTTIAPNVIESEVGSQEASQESSVEVKGTGDEKKDQQLKKLNKGLAKLRHEIELLEEEEVNWDDDDSAYMRKVKYEKRAIEIYKKICEITGESTHAHRIVKQPVTFKNTDYKEFNKKLTKKINKENGFPSYYDVYRLLDFCNKEYKYNLNQERVKNIALKSFLEVGKLLKERRTNDLYESATHWAGKERDPAKNDSELKTKLEKNRQFYEKKTDELMEQFANRQMKGDIGCSGDDDDDDDNDEDVEMKTEEPCTSTAITTHDSTINGAKNELQVLPTKEIVNIDVSAEQLDCDMANGDIIQLEDSNPIIELSL